MKLSLRPLFFSPTAAFAWFAILLAARDISAEVFLAENSLSLAFAICTTIVVLSFAMILISGQGLDLIAKLKSPGVLWRATLLGTMSGAIYGGIFYLIAHMGVGLFAMIDYGLVPLATLTVGMVFFKEKVKIEFLAALVIYLVGVVFLFVERGMFGMDLLFFALFCPIATAASDGLTKWLLSPEHGKLTRPQLLVIRFLPASIALFLFSYFFSEAPMAIANWPRTLFVSVCFGWLPLWLLCTGLVRQGLSKLAIFEFLIPAVAFFGTLNLHPELIAPLPIIGGFLILAAIVVSQTSFLSRLMQRKKHDVVEEESTAA